MEMILTLAACVLIALFAAVITNVFDTPIPIYVIGLVGDIVLAYLGFVIRDINILTLGTGLSLVMLVAIVIDVRSLIRRGRTFRMP